jgi:hypothetical protein
MGVCDKKCDNCQCPTPETHTCDNECGCCSDEEVKTPNLDILNELNALQGMREPETEEAAGKISIDRENADLYAFSDISLKTLREGKDAEINPLDWSNREIIRAAGEVVGNKLNV